MTALALQYRPVRFADVVAQGHIKPILRAMVASGRVPPVLLFSGPRGTGKTSLARILAAALNCERPDNGDACGECDSCRSVQSVTSTAVTEVDAATSGSVEDVRELTDMVGYSTVAEWRVVFLDEAHSMSRAAFNALLKTLEQPPPNTVFILVTTEPAKIPDTVVSRSQQFEFRRLTALDIQQRLRYIADVERLHAPDDLLAEIAARSEGSMRDAAMKLDQLSYIDVADVESYRELFGYLDLGVPLLSAALDGDRARGFGLIEEFFGRVGDPSLLVVDLVSLIRDLFILSAAGVPPGATESALGARRALAGRVESSQLVRAVRVLWELKTRARPTEPDQRAQVEMGWVLLCEALGPEQAVQPIQAPSPEGAQRLTIDAMAAMAARMNGGNHGSEQAG